MFIERLHVLSAVLVATSSFVNAQEKEPIVRVVFQNTTATAVEIFLIDDSDENSKEGTEVMFAPQLPPGKQHLQQATSGVIWRIKQNDTTIAEYVSTTEVVQVVDIQEVADWQAPVEIVVQNTTEAPIDIFWINDANKEIAIAEALPPNREFTTSTMPGHSWVIKQSGKMIAEFIADSHKEQIIDTAKLATWWHSVDLVFQNLTNHPIDIYCVDGEGAEICFTVTDERKPHPLPPGMRMRQAANPLSTCRIRKKGTLIAEYAVDNEPRQIIDILAK